MTGRLVPTNGVELWIEEDGDAAAPVVLLLGGADSSALRWPAGFVAALVDAGRRVVRVEHRDSGCSTKIDPDAPYRLEDLALDTVGVLDALGVDAADVVGYSMGGAVAQLLALDHAPRVRALVLLATTPGMGDDRLPFAADWFVERMSERLFAPPPRTDADRVAWTVDLYRLLAGERYPFDEAGQRDLAEAELARCWYPESGHGVASTASPSRLDRLDAVAAPTVVVHGSHDPVYTLAHGEALAAGIPGATLVVVEGLGHEVPAAFSADLAALVLKRAITLRASGRAITLRASGRAITLRASGRATGDA
jgi:pimeloyl-ACP methyl ester carboxylesterase